MLTILLSAVLLASQQGFITDAFVRSSNQNRALFRASTIAPTTIIATNHLQQQQKPSSALRSFSATLASLPQAAKIGVALAAFIAAALNLNKALWVPSRKYDQESNSVGKEYDAWESDGILEYYWGEHIHLGYYTDDVIRESDWLPPKKNFIQAKFDFIDEMLKFGKFDTTSKPKKILDVGCGIGGTTRYLAKAFGPETEITGITLSGNQVNRATALAKEQGTPNAKFVMMDALKMTYPDNSFDLVWACESGEHMPDKQAYVEEMTRVLKPGGRIVIATWCQRDEGNSPFNDYEKKMLRFLYDEWTHPYFISINDYKNLMEGTGQLRAVVTADWTRQTITSWLHSIWVGVFDPWPVFTKPRVWLKTFYDGLALYRMHKSFRKGLMQYGMMCAIKKDEGEVSTAGLF